ncbi:MAG TPA: preprotein translocase subunit YajC [Pirellulales bacterium]
MHPSAWAELGFLVLGQADPTANAWFQPLVQLVIPCVAILGIFYFVVMRAEKRIRDEQAALLNGIKKNDKVLTQGGIVGVVTKESADGKMVTIRTAESTYLDVYRAFIQRKITEASEAEEAKKSG